MKKLLQEPLQAVVVHSGGMDSSICLALAIEKYGSDQVLSLSFDYDQRHYSELAAAEKIAKHLHVAHEVVDLSKVMSQWQASALVNKSQAIVHAKNGIPGRPLQEPPNTFVIGRNGIFAHMAALIAGSRGASVIYLGVMELESANSGYPDCSRAYMDLVEQLVCLDLQNPHFRIETPLIYEDKCTSLAIAHRLHLLPYFLKETITCYEGIAGEGCTKCPSCLLRNEGIKRFFQK